MRKAEALTMTLTLAAVLFFCLCPPAWAQIYKYKDESGVWHFTDDPMEVPSQFRETDMGGESGHGENGFDLALQLSEKIKPANDIERAALGTVVVKSAYGKGTGFFISENGHIITNKHVIQGTRQQEAGNEQQYESYERQFEIIDRRLDEEEKELQAAQQRLYSLKEMARTERNDRLRKNNEADYNRMKSKYDRWEKDFNRRKELFREQKAKLAYEKSNYLYKKSLAGLDSNYQIRLADGREMYVSLVAVSSTRDLALLKLARYRTPHLSPTPHRRLPQGEQVYAIGNPINLRHSVTTGIISGYQDGFVKTDTKIYPGNSGGPLVTKNGEVVGINTFKQITYKFEGLGFAISIHDALNEFNGYLQ